MAVDTAQRERAMTVEETTIDAWSFALFYEQSRDRMVTDLPDDGRVLPRTG